MKEPLEPWEALKSVVTSLTMADAIWIGVGIIGVFIFYSLAIARKKRDETTWRVVLFWLIAALGWLFIMHMVTYKKISSGGPWAVAVLGIAAVGVTATVTILTRKTRLWERVVSGAIIAVIGFGILASFGRGYESWGYALVMGLILGVILGMLWSARRALQATSGRLIEDLEQNGATARKEEGYGKRKVTEI